MVRVAVASRSFSRNEVLRAELLSQFPNTTFNDAGVSLKGAALVEFLQDTDRAVIALEPIDANVLHALPDLKVIAKYGVGFDKIDLHAMLDKGVQLGWRGGVNRRSVSELTIAFAISLLRLLPQACASVAEGEWRQHVGRQLSECTVGLIGCGHVGKDAAQILRNGFGAKVLAFDEQSYGDFYRREGVEPASLETLLAQSDVVSIHLPLDKSTVGILSADKLALMKHDAVLINTARGGLVDETALKDQLKSGKLGGAGFDVFATEPPEDQELLSLPNFMVTPHVGGSSEEAILAMGRTAIQGLSEFRDPQPGAFPPGRW